MPPNIVELLLMFSHIEAYEALKFITHTNWLMRIANVLIPVVPIHWLFASKCNVLPSQPPHGCQWDSSDPCHAFCRSSSEEPDRAIRVEVLDATDATAAVTHSIPLRPTPPMAEQQSIRHAMLAAVLVAMQPSQQWVLCNTSISSGVPAFQG